MNANGDFVVVHLGKAVRRVADADVLDTIGLYSTVTPEAGDDAQCLCYELVLEPA